jgi:hypothetical protein
VVPASALVGVRVATPLPVLYVTNASTATFDGFLSVNVVPVIVPEFIGSLNVAVTTVAVLTLAAPLGGEKFVTVGGVVSATPAVVKNQTKSAVIGEFVAVLTPVAPP